MHRTGVLFQKGFISCEGVPLQRYDDVVQFDVRIKPEKWLKWCIRLYDVGGLFPVYDIFSQTLPSHELPLPSGERRSPANTGRARGDGDPLRVILCIARQEHGRGCPPSLSDPPPKCDRTTGGMGGHPSCSVNCWSFWCEMHSMVCYLPWCFVSVTVPPHPGEHTQTPPP